MAISSWILEAIEIYFILHAFQINFEISNIMFIYVISSLIGAALFLLGSVGAAEGSLLGFLILNKLTCDETIGPVVMIRICSLWYAIIIGIIFTTIFKLNNRFSNIKMNF